LFSVSNSIFGRPLSLQKILFLVGFINFFLFLYTSLSTLLFLFCFPLHNRAIRSVKVGLKSLIHCRAVLYSRYGSLDDAVAACTQRDGGLTQRRDLPNTFQIRTSPAVAPNRTLCVRAFSESVVFVGSTSFFTSNSVQSYKTFSIRKTFC
jgi:hypothetical protein